MNKLLYDMISDARAITDRMWRRAICRSISRVLASRLSYVDEETICRYVFSRAPIRHVVTALIERADSAYIKSVVR